MLAALGCRRSALPKPSVRLQHSSLTSDLKSLVMFISPIVFFLAEDWSAFGCTLRLPGQCILVIAGVWLFLHHHHHHLQKWSQMSLSPTPTLYYLCVCWRPLIYNMRNMCPPYVHKLVSRSSSAEQDVVCEHSEFNGTWGCDITHALSMGVEARINFLSQLALDYPVPLPRPSVSSRSSRWMQRQWSRATISVLSVGH